MGISDGIFLALFVYELIYIAAITQPAPSVVGNPPQTDIGREYQPVTLINMTIGISVRDNLFRPMSGQNMRSRSGPSSRAVLSIFIEDCDTFRPEDNI